MNLWCPPPTQSPILPLIQLQSSSESVSHPAGSPLRPLTPAAEQTGEWGGKWSAVRVRKSEGFLCVGYTRNTKTWPLDLQDSNTNTPTQSHTSKPTTFLISAPAWVLSPCFGCICWGTPRVLSHSWTLFTLLPEFTWSTLIPAAHAALQLRWSVHLY